MGALESAVGRRGIADLLVADARRVGEVVLVRLWGEGVTSQEFVVLWLGMVGGIGGIK